MRLLKAACAAICLAATPLWGAWYSNAFLNRIPLTIQGSAVTGTLTNFPALVTLLNHADLSNRAHTLGWDIMFTGSDGATALPHEIESYTNGTLAAWVSIPVIQANVSTNCYLYYNNSNVAMSLEDGIAVWDSNYLGVWHMKKTGSSNMDSTSNALHGVEIGGALSNTPGVAATAVAFDGATSYFDHGDPATIKYATNHQTIEMWLLPSRTNQRSNPLGKSYGGEFTVSYEPAGTMNYFFGAAGGDNSPYTSISAGTLETNAWVYAAFTRDFASRNMSSYRYSQASRVALTNAINLAFSNATPSTKTFRIGKGYVSNFPGLIDEVRLSSVARSSQWIATTYSNLIAPMAFVTNQIVQSLNAISVTLTNVQGGAMVAVGATLRGLNNSYAGIKETRLIISNAASVEVYNAPVTLVDSQTWQASPMVPAGDYQVVLVSTNSNGAGGSSPQYGLKMRVVSRLTVRSLLRSGSPCVGGRVVGPSFTANPSAGARTNDAAGEAFFDDLYSGIVFALSNFTPGQWGGARVTTNLVMPETNCLLVWNLEGPEGTFDAGKETISNLVYSPSRFPWLAIRIPGTTSFSQRVLIQATRLAGGRKSTLFDGMLAGGESEIRIPSESLRHQLDAGVWVLEFRFPDSKKDVSADRLYWRMLFCSP